MGSDSDLPVMQEASKVLTEFGIGHEVHTLSAHRTPAAVMSYVQKSEADGYKAFICAAGGAAHLAGVVAAHTALPVIGVPIMNKSTGGIDALYSTVQMPPGIPVFAGMERQRRPGISSNWPLYLGPPCAGPFFLGEKAFRNTAV